MNIVVILAGGSGKRFGADKPKQFVEVLGKPLIVYALEMYQNSKLIDAIEVVSLPEYIDSIWRWKEVYSIDKLKWICKGGKNCQESIKNGIFNLQNVASDEDLLCFNMSTSIFVDDKILEDSLRVAREHGSAFAAMQCIYNNAETFDGVSSNNIHFKETHKTLNLPWTSTYKKLSAMYKKAFEENIEIGDASYMPTLFLALGEKLYFSKDTSLNKIHVTASSDLEIVTSILEHRIAHNGSM